MTGLMNPRRWTALMGALGLAEHLPTYSRIEAAYAEPQRHYHTGRHIDLCLAELDTVRTFAGSAAEVELALWFHDVVYEPRATDNELRSARLAADFLACADAPAESAARVHALVMATMHEAEPHDPDARLLVDIDLSILGRAAEIYDWFERGVRREYRWVPAFVYRRKRAEVLRSFLERPSIYFTPALRDRYEAPARANLQRAIRALGR